MITTVDDILGCIDRLREFVASPPPILTPDEADNVAAMQLRLIIRKLGGPLDPGLRGRLGPGEN